MLVDRGHLVGQVDLGAGKRGPMRNNDLWKPRLRHDAPDLMSVTLKICTETC
jgi:hypothetical protein